MTAADDFEAVVHRPEDEVRLDEAWALITVHARPDVEPAALLTRLDALAADLDVPTLDGLVAHLFADLGFRGATEDYYDPANSYLDCVLERRRGIPITLSVLAMEVGRRIGVPVAGVGMPGHFLLRDRVDPTVFVDPFAGGTLLDEGGCRRLFQRLHGPDAQLAAAWLEPVGPHAIVARLLANLVRTFAERRDQRNLLWALNLRARLPGATDEDRRTLLALQARQN